MLDSYIILNSKNTSIIKFYSYSFILFTLILSYFILNLTHITYFQKTSNIILKNNNYYLKIIIPIKKLNLLTENNYLMINNTKYNYQVKNISLYKNNKIFLYLQINNLDNSYKINNNSINIKIKEEKKILEYIKI